MNRIILSIIIIVIGCGAAYFFYFKKPAAAMLQGQGQMEVEVTIAKIKKEQVELFREFPARIAARKIAEIRPQVTGNIKKRLFTEGQKVEEGQQLYEIDQSIYSADLTAARGRFDAAQANFKRGKFLVNEEAISPKEFEDIKTEYGRAKGELEKAQTNLNFTKVLAPISGYISKSNFTEGNLVTAGQASALATITQLNPLFADIAVPSKNFADFKNQKESKVALIIDGKEYGKTGFLKFSEVFADSATDSIKLRAEFDNEGEELLPGMFARARIYLPAFENIIVAQKATTRNPDGSLTLVVVDENSVTHVKPIKIKGIFKDFWIVEDGLNEGESVIIEGYQKVKEGMKVKTVTKDIAS